jgi:hypothetical protein
MTVRETGIMLGSLVLDDVEWSAIAQTPVFSIRIDEHPEIDGWQVTQQDGTTSLISFVIPMHPVIVPKPALSGGRALSEWVEWAHGGLGRLLLWDSLGRWWLAHEPDLELVLVCAPAGMIQGGSDELSWWTTGTEQGRDEVRRLHERYGIET